MKQLPNIVTLFNLLFGCLAIVCILQPGENIALLSDDQFIINLPEKIVWGAIFIGCAALVDFFDGFVARLLQVNSPIGKELDSLADVVSFGVAPGMILYQLLRMSYLREPSAFDTSVWLLLPAVLFPAAAAYRLAKFNVDTRQAYGFIGVPTPAAGLLVASLPLIVYYNQLNLDLIIVNKWFLYGMLLVVSYLMISNVPILSLKFKSFQLKDNWSKVILALVAVFCAVLVKWVAVPVVFIVYVLLSVVMARKGSPVENMPQGTV